MQHWNNFAGKLLHSRYNVSPSPHSSRKRPDSSYFRHACPGSWTIHTLSPIPCLQHSYLADSALACRWSVRSVPLAQTSHPTRVPPSGSQTSVASSASRLIKPPSRDVGDFPLSKCSTLRWPGGGHEWGFKGVDPKRCWRSGPALLR